MAEILTARVEHLQALVLGNSSTSIGADTVGELGPDINFLRAKIDSILNESAAVEQSLPQLKACRELLGKLHLDIYKRKTTLSNIQERVNELISNRVSIEQAINNVKSLNQLSNPAFINHDGLYDISVLRDRLDKIENLLRPLIARTQQQSLEIDMYLDSYEEMMKLMDHCTERWISEQNSKHAM